MSSSSVDELLILDGMTDWFYSRENFHFNLTFDMVLCYFHFEFLMDTIRQTSDPWTLINLQPCLKKKNLSFRFYILYSSFSLRSFSALPINCADFPLTLSVPLVPEARGYRLTLEGKCNLQQKTKLELTLPRKLLMQVSLLLGEQKKINKQTT